MIFAEPIIPERWRGFNLLGKFEAAWSNDGYIEEDFILIKELGFNFVRLPIDYRTYTESGDWYAYNEKSLANIDQAVAWGKKYGIHVNINLHRAPGYCVNKPGKPLPASEDKDLWTDKDAQAAFISHWQMFAKRYKGVANSIVSFNLINEPPDMPGDAYAAVMGLAINAVREIDPRRLIIIDALRWGNEPCYECLSLNVVQSPHFYEPFRITHYKAEWVDGARDWPVPSWPLTCFPGFLYGPEKKDIQTPLVINGDFKPGTEVSITIHQVSTRSRLVVKADASVIIDKTFVPGPGKGEWKEVVFADEWKIYQNIYDTIYSGTIKKATASLVFENTEGDWLSFSQISIAPKNCETILLNPSIDEWGVPQAVYKITDDGGFIVKKFASGFENFFLTPDPVAKWKELEAKGGMVHIGEWGVYKFTPHKTTLAFMEDRLRSMKAAGFGWALWNFRGPFGILDSGRADVTYEDFHGHKLDRKMLELLKKY